MAKAVRQMRGPGMNKGLKKPRYGKFPNPSSETSSGRKDYKKTASSAGKAPQASYLSPMLGGKSWGRS